MDIVKTKTTRINNMYKSRPDAEWLEIKRKTITSHDITPQYVADTKAALLSKGYRIANISFFANQGNPFVRIEGEKENIVRYQSPYI